MLIIATSRINVSKSSPGKCWAIRPRTWNSLQWRVVHRRREFLAVVRRTFDLRYFVVLQRNAQWLHRRSDEKCISIILWVIQTRALFVLYDIVNSQHNTLCSSVSVPLFRDRCQDVVTDIPIYTMAQKSPITTIMTNNQQCITYIHT